MVSLFAFLSAIVFLLLFLLLKQVLLKHLPELPKGRLIFKRAPCNLFQVVSAGHSALVVRSQLSIEHNFRNLYVAQCLLTPTQHEKAAA